MRHSTDLDPTLVGHRVVAFLRRTYPSKTAMRVAADIRCSVGTIEKWIERESTPSGAMMLRLFLAYGPPFICAVVDNPPAWLDERQRATRRIELEAGIARQQAELAQLEARA